MLAKSVAKVNWSVRAINQELKLSERNFPSVSLWENEVDMWRELTSASPITTISCELFAPAYPIRAEQYFLTELNSRK